MTRKQIQSAGFTLIEIMVVVAIFGVLMAGASFAFRNVTRADLRSGARQTASAMRFAFDRAMIGGGYYRLAFDFDQQTVTLEFSEQRVMLIDAEEEKRRDEEREKETDEEKEADDAPDTGFNESASTSMLDSMLGGALFDADEMKRLAEQDSQPFKRRPPQFQPFSGLGKRVIKMKGSVQIESVMTPRMTKPVTEGKAYIYFFPQGYTEPAIVRLVDQNETAYSIVLHPLSGRAEVHACRFKVPESFGLKDDQQSQDVGDLCES